MAIAQLGFALTVIVACVAGMPDNHDHEHKLPILPGKCPDFPAFAALDVSKMAGEWYVMECGRHGIEMSEERGRCVKMSLKPNSDGGITSTITLMKGDKSISHTSTKVPVEGHPGKFTITSDMHLHDMDAVLTVLDTDYVNYGVGVLCINVGDHHGYFAEVLSREKSMDSDLLEKANAAIKAADIEIEMKAVDHSGC